MLTDVLLEHRWLAPAVLVILVVLGPVVGAWLVERPRPAWSLAGLATLTVAVLTLLPTDRELFARCTVEWMLPTPSRVELFANVVLFVAPTLLAGVASRRPVVVFAAASAIAAAIEALQAAVPAIGRSCDTTDWLSNTIGAAIGAVLAAAALGLARRYRASRA